MTSAYGDTHFPINPLEPIDCAFVGCGGIAEQYWGLYATLPQVRVVACLDTNSSAAERAISFFAEKTGVTPRNAHSLEEVLATSATLVLINTPNHLHMSQAVAALRAGKDVLLQKPLAGTLHDAAVIVREAALSGRRCGVYMSYLDNPLINELIGLSQSRSFGRPTKLHGRYMHRGGLLWSQQQQDGQGTWRSSVAQTGGGVFIQLGVHYIHIFRRLVDSPVRSVYARKANLYCKHLEGEDSASALIEFENGVTATLDTAWNSLGEELSCFGTNGSFTFLDNRWLFLDKRDERSDDHFHKDTVASAPICHEPVSPSDDQPFNQHRCFIEALQQGTPVPVSAESSLEDMCIVAAFYRSASSNLPVLVQDLRDEALLIVACTEVLETTMTLNN